MKTEIFNGRNRVLLVLGQMTGAHCKDCFIVTSIISFCNFFIFLISTPENIDIQ